MFFTGYKMATSGHFFVAIIFCGYGIKLSGYFGLLVRVQMAVGFHGGLHPFVSQAFCYQKWRTAHVNQQTGVGMAYIVHPDLLCSRVVATILHLSADPSPIIREDTVCRLYIVELCQIVFQAVFQHLQHNHFTIASFCLRRIDIIFSIQTLVVLVDRNKNISAFWNLSVRNTKRKLRNWNRLLSVYSKSRFPFRRWNRLKQSPCR